MVRAEGAAAAARTCASGSPSRVSRHPAGWVTTTPNATAAIYDDALAVAMRVNKMGMHAALLRLILRKIIEDEHDPSVLDRWVPTPNAIPAVYDEALAPAVHVNKTDMVAALLPHAYANTLTWHAWSEEDVKVKFEDRISIRQTDESKMYFHRVICHAYEQKNETIMGLLLQVGACPHVWVTIPDVVDFHEGPPLFMAAMEGKKDIVQLFIKYGAHIDDHKSFTVFLFGVTHDGQTVGVQATKMPRQARHRWAARRTVPVASRCRSRPSFLSFPPGGLAPAPRARPRGKWDAITREAASAAHKQTSRLHTW